MRRLEKPKSHREPTIALINIVFLMLVFFMVAGTLAAPLDTSMALVETRDLEGRAPPDTLLIHPDGRLSFRGEDLENIATYMETLPEEERKTIRLVPDRALEAAALVALTRELRTLGAEQVMIVTKRGLE